MAVALALALTGAGPSAADQNMVSVHWDVLGTSAYQRAGDYPSDFSAADDANGNWGLLPNTDGSPALGYIETAGTPSGMVEVHLDSLTGTQYSRVSDYVSQYIPAEAALGDMQLFSAQAGPPELGYIALRNTGSGTVEVHWETLQNGVLKDGGDYSSDFPESDAGDGTWQLLGTPSGTPVLGFIQTANTGSGMVEIHVDALKGNQYARIADYATGYTPAEAANGLIELFGASGGITEVGYIDLRNTVSGSVEMHWETVQNGAFATAGDYASDFPESLAADGTWQVFTPGADAPPELGFIETPPSPPVQPVVQSQSVPAPPNSRTPKGKLGRVRVKFVFGWTWSHAHTRLHYVRATGAPRGARIEIRCAGAGRPHRYKHLQRLLRSMRGPVFRAGDVLTITISAPDKRAERITVRIRAGALPRVRLL
jgi:hypothetical protein